ncbi:MAG: hypothetical protein QM661_07505 [Solimonas sp.]
MKPKHHRKPPHHNEAPKVRRPAGFPTKSQLRAIANAEAQAHSARWKTLIEVAASTWSKLHAVELGHSKGDSNVLAGLIQMRYQIGRLEADAQVKSFFEKHAPTAPAPVAPLHGSAASIQ